MRIQLKHYLPREDLCLDHNQPNYDTVHWLDKKLPSSCMHCSMNSGQPLTEFSPKQRLSDLSPLFFHFSSL